MADTITPDDLVKAITSACAQFNDDVREKITDGVEKIGREAVEEVEALSPVYTGKSKKVKRRNYKRGWRYQVEKRRGTVKVTVHNSKNHQLTHLLENQHLTRDGTTYSRAFPHIGIANANAEKKVDRLIKELGNGTG